MAKRSKNYQDALKLIDRTKKYELDEAVQLLRKVSYSKFDPTIEFSIKLAIDPRKAEQNLRGAIVLPHGTGKTQRVLVIAEGEKAKEAEAAGADYVGTTEYIEQIQKGWFEFDVIVATPNMMSQLGKLGRVLGPKGLMPNPKTGTVTMDVANAVSEIKAGKVEYRTDKVGNIHVPVGKLSFEDDKLIENIKTIYDQMIRIKPATAKGNYVQNVSISSTMSPGIKIIIEKK